MGCELRDVEFLRFGSSIPGNYWGCCAVDIIQSFRSSPDKKTSCQSISGDGGYPDRNLFFGPTNRDIFMQRLRLGTFGGGQDMPNHAFLAVITEDQIQTSNGLAWLAILKENGFEFIRTVTNSVYSGPVVASELSETSNEDGCCGCGDPDCDEGNGGGDGSYRNYVFGLFRNIGTGGPVDPFTPPQAWLDLPSIKKEVWQSIDDAKALAKDQFDADKKVWDKIGPAVLLTEEEVEKAGASVVYAGVRPIKLQQAKKTRDAILAKESEDKGKSSSLRSPEEAFPVLQMDI